MPIHCGNSYIMWKSSKSTHIAPNLKHGEGTEPKLEHWLWFRWSCFRRTNQLETSAESITPHEYQPVKSTHMWRKSQVSNVTCRHFEPQPGWHVTLIRIYYAITDKVSVSPQGIPDRWELFLNLMSPNNIISIIGLWGSKCSTSRR